MQSNILASVYLLGTCFYFNDTNLNSFGGLRNIKEYKQEDEEFLLIISHSGNFHFQGKTELIQGVKFFLTFAQQSREIGISNEMVPNSDGDLILFEKCCELCEEDFLNKASQWLEKNNEELSSSIQ